MNPPISRLKGNFEAISLIEFNIASISSGPYLSTSCEGDHTTTMLDCFENDKQDKALREWHSSCCCIIALSYAIRQVIPIS